MGRTQSCQVGGRENGSSLRCLCPWLTHCLSLSKSPVPQDPCALCSQACSVLPCTPLLPVLPPPSGLPSLPGLPALTSLALLAGTHPAAMLCDALRIDLGLPRHGCVGPGIARGHHQQPPSPWRSPLQHRTLSLQTSGLCWLQSPLHMLRKLPELTGYLAGFFPFQSLCRVLPSCPHRGWVWAQWGLEGLGLVPEPCTFQSASWGCRPSVSEPSWDPGPHLSLEVRQCQLLSVLVNRHQLHQLTAKSIAQMRELSSEKGRGAMFTQAELRCNSAQSNLLSSTLRRSPQGVQVAGGAWLIG